jgi:SagB-type dehydrogenase family enzyme
MSPFPLWSFREDVFVESEPDDATVVLHSRWEDTTLKQLRPAAVRALRRMSLGPAALSNVITEEADWRAVEAILDDLQHLVVRSFGLDPEQPLVSVVPLTPEARLRLPAELPAYPVRLSRFAVIRTDGSNFLVESPLSLHRIILHGAEAMAALGTLIRPAVPKTSDPALLTLIGPLIAVGMVVDAGADPFDPVEYGDDADPAMVGWDPIELLFHTRATLGRHDHDFGVTYPMGESAAVEPVVKPPRPGAAVDLRRPGFDELIAADPPLSAVIEASRNSRHLAAGPVTVDELGSLLYRTARVRSVIGDPNSAEATSDRPYANTGRGYELEIYATVQSCEGVPRGLYRYDPLGHRLEPLPADQADLDELLETSRVAANLSAPPAVLLTVTARFQRVSWKYSGLGYSLVLRNFGALSQLLSLVCVALGLAGHRIDAAEIAVSSRIFGIDWRVESSVGGFAVGRLAPPRPGSGVVRPANDADWPDRARAHPAAPGPKSDK